MQGKGEGSALVLRPRLRWGHGEEKRRAPGVGPTLPEGEEDDCLDGDELEDRLKRAQEVHGGKVE